MIPSATLEQKATRSCCAQPGCLLRHRDMSTEKLAAYMVRLLAGESPECLEPGNQRICVRPGCTRCAARILSGGRALPTDAEWAHLDQLGQWHRRREQRRARWRH